MKIQTKSYKKSNELFKPIPITSPQDYPIIFFIRCLIDLQLKSIVDFLRLELSKLENEVLDIGAGNSPWRSFLSSSINYVGLDIENANDFSMKTGKDIIYYSGRDFPFVENQFSNALCIEVLEHICDTEYFLREIFRCLKPGGKLILTVPWAARRHHLPYDYFRFTPEALNYLLEKNGFINIKITERGNDLATIFNKILCLIQGLIFSKNIKTLILRFLILLIITPIGFIFLLMAHISLLFKSSSQNDPLGYSLIASKPLKKTV